MQRKTDTKGSNNRMADEIFVINVGGYIGSSTRSEIEYANATGKPVRYLEEEEFVVEL